MAITRDTEITNGDAAYMSTQQSRSTTHIDFTGSLSLNAILADMVKFVDRIGIVEFAGKRTTRGTSSSPTVVSLIRGSDDAVISTTTFTYAAGNNVEKSGAIVTTSSTNVIDPHDHVYVKVTSAGDAVGFHGNITVQNLYNE